MLLILPLGPREPTSRLSDAEIVDCIGWQRLLNGAERACSSRLPYAQRAPTTNRAMTEPMRDVATRIVRNTSNTLTTLAFVALISAPAVVMLTQESPTIATTENRRLARMPDWSWDWAAISNFPNAFEKYFSDAFGLRPTLTHWHHSVCFRVFGKSPTDMVVVGKDDWLFLDLSMQMYRRDVSFTDEEVALQASLLQQRHDWLAWRGIKYLVVLVPNKPEVYPEYVPAHTHQRWPENHTDRLEAYAKSHCSFEVLNLRPILAEARKQHETYNPADCHWNDFGAYIGYRAVIDRLTKHFPDMKPLTLEECSVETRQATGDLMWMIGLQEITEPRIFITPKTPRAQGTWSGVYDATVVMTVDDERLPKAVVMHDSFMTAMHPFLEQHFRETTFRRVYSKIDPRPIVQRKPDIVIQEIVERAMHDLTKNPPHVRVPETPKRPQPKLVEGPAGSTRS